MYNSPAQQHLLSRLPPGTSCKVRLRGLFKLDACGCPGATPGRGEPWSTRLHQSIEKNRARQKSAHLISARITSSPPSAPCCCAPAPAAFQGSNPTCAPERASGHRRMLHDAALSVWMHRPACQAEELPLTSLKTPLSSISSPLRSMILAMSWMVLPAVSTLRVSPSLNCSSTKDWPAVASSSTCHGGSAHPRTAQEEVWRHGRSALPQRTNTQPTALKHLELDLAGGVALLGLVRAHALQQLARRHRRAVARLERHEHPLQVLEHRSSLWGEAGRCGALDHDLHGRRTKVREVSSGRTRSLQQETALQEVRCTQTRQVGSGAAAESCCQRRTRCRRQSRRNARKGVIREKVVRPRESSCCCCRCCRKCVLLREQAGPFKGTPTAAMPTSL